MQGQKNIKLQACFYKQGHGYGRAVGAVAPGKDSRGGNINAIMKK
jgi:hypothetical protein